MSYAVPQDVINRYPNRDLVQLTNEDPTAVTVNTAFLQLWLNDASNLIDSYLEARFALPLSDPPAILTSLCIDIAMYKMQALRPLHDLEDARNRHEDAVKYLTGVNQGKITLGLSADGAEPPEAQSEVVVQAGGDPSGVVPQRVFSRGSLKGF